jgi:hypothetical protein
VAQAAKHTAAKMAAKILFMTTLWQSEATGDGIDGEKL